MKPFDLRKALAGEPVVLRCGSKAYVLGDLRDLFPESKEVRCLIGIDSEREHSKQYSSTMRWKCNGSYYEHIYESEYDIIGMYEEPKLTTEELMEKAFTEGIPVKHALLGKYHDGFNVVAKTRNGSYILQERGDVLKLHYLDTFSDAIQWRLME